MAKQTCPSCDAVIDDDEVVKPSPRIARLDKLEEINEKNQQKLDALHEKLDKILKGGEENGGKKRRSPWSIID